MKRPDLADPYRRRGLTAAAACLALLVLLSVAVVTGVVDSLDIAVRNHFRPDFVWGADQQRASHVVSALGPAHMVFLLAIGSALMALWRLNIWPVLQAGVALAATGALTLSVKLIVDRADPGGHHTSLGGAFPSGHSATLIVATLTGAMLISCPTRWWQRFAVALLWIALAVAMLYDTVHWLSDIVAGALAAGVVLGAMATALGPNGGPSHVVRRRGCTGRAAIPQSSDQHSGKIS
jgi:undecaprenyl-diphosphatase